MGDSRLDADIELPTPAYGLTVPGPTTAGTASVAGTGPVRFVRHAAALRDTAMLRPRGASR
ncbi:hypothetical protein CC117_12530 [Parafrankia colletiae]|uniref:Uncharacterized protein n=1 Tax=Parafrankia colletiae TaxID=573497 RepID=A0A1S1R8V7_9ACTN|nr:hypothetical protein CC117_12530 [Parafrankia colletiae]